MLSRNAFHGATSASVALLCCIAVSAQTANPPEIPVNYDEAQAGTYVLPDPLVLANGQKVKTADAWFSKRRPEIVRLFESNMHGKSPSRPEAMTFDVFDKGTPALEGKALRRQVTVNFSKEKSGPKMDIAIYLPSGVTKPVPLLLCLNFTANAVADAGAKQGEVWGRDKKKMPSSKGLGAGKLQIDNLLAHGFGVATIYYGDIDPDFAGGIPHGVRSLYLKSGQSEPAPDEWGSISAWAWGLSRAMDYLETDSGVDAKRVAILGVSRLGKTVLWAGAHDTRFAMGIASLFRRGRSVAQPAQLWRDREASQRAVRLSVF